MGNAPPKKKRRVTFDPSIRRDRFEESTLRYNHILTVHNQYVKGNDDVKDKLALLVLAFFRRCDENRNMTAENIHEMRVKNVCDIALTTFVGHVTDVQVRALVASLCVMLCV
jgi:hypothetical protein